MIDLSDSKIGALGDITDMMKDAAYNEVVVELAVIYNGNADSSAYAQASYVFVVDVVTTPAD